MIDCVDLLRILILSSCSEIPYKRFIGESNNLFGKFGKKIVSIMEAERERERGRERGKKKKNREKGKEERRKEIKE